MLPVKRLDMLSQSLIPKVTVETSSLQWVFKNDGNPLNGISILSISETAGLGMKATTDSFKDQPKKQKRRKIYIHKKQVPHLMTKLMPSAVQPLQQMP